jgi:hypothetical protein
MRLEELGCPDGSVVIRTGLTVALGAGGTCGDALADAEAVNARLEAVNAHAAMRLQMRRVGPPSGAVMGAVMGAVVGAVMGAVMGAVYGRDAAAGSRDRVEIACGHVCGVARCREWRLDRHPTRSRRMPSPRQCRAGRRRCERCARGSFGYANTVNMMLSACKHMGTYLTARDPRHGRVPAKFSQGCTRVPLQPLER